MRQHIKAVGWLQIGLSILWMIIVFAIAILFWGVGIFSHDHEAIEILNILVPIIIVCGILTALPSIIGGFFLLKYKEWSRILVIIISFINLVNFPIGTAVGVYSLWVLLNKDSIDLFIEQPVGATSDESANI